jgi:hypothetical protein
MSSSPKAPRSRCAPPVAEVSSWPLMVTLVTKALRRSGTMRSIAGAGHVQVERGESGKKSEVARAPQQGVTKYLSFGCSFSRPWPPVRTTHATPRNRFVLGRASTSRRSPGACARCPQWSTKRLELAPRRQSQGRTAGHVQNTTRTLSGTGICAWSRLLLRVRPTRLSLRLARRSVGGRDKQERSLALRLRGRMAIVEYPK